MSEPETIAERVIYAVDNDARGFDVGIMIGKPYQTDFKYGDWACPVALIGLHGRFPDMYGVDSWQALIVAVRLVKALLTNFVEEGGKLYWEKGGEEITVAELFGKSTEVPTPDWPPTEEEQARIDKLTPEEIHVIDEAILASVSAQWRKVARVVGGAIIATAETVPDGVPDIFYGERVRQLVAAGKVESQGDLNCMRFSEIRLGS